MHTTPLHSLPLVDRITTLSTSPQSTGIYFQQQPSTTRTIRRWSPEANDALQDCFETTDWDVLCEAQKKRSFKETDRDKLKCVQRELKLRIAEGKRVYKEKMEDKLKQSQNLGVPKQKAAEDTMSDGGLFKAEVIYIRDCEKRGAGDMVQQETYTQPHKIKLSYKTLAAIPTNTLLLDQQAIDDQVDQGDSQDPVTRRKKEDTHAEMCSPAQLRKQSEDLYAVIDHVLEDPVPIRQASPALAYPRETMDKYAPKRYTSLPRSLGRETKYATFNLQPSVERELTKPGVIRPANIIPRLPEEKYDEAFHPNPFRQYLDELTVNDQNKLENTLWGKMGADGNRSSGNLSLNTETNHENNSTTEEEDNISVSSLLITESEEPNANTAKDGPWQGGATSFNPTKVKMEAFETHI